MRDYIYRLVTPPERVTSPTWGLQSPCKTITEIYRGRCLSNLVSSHDDFFVVICRHMDLFLLFRANAKSHTKMCAVNARNCLHPLAYTSNLIHWTSWKQLTHCAGIKVVIDNLMAHLYLVKITCRVLICFSWAAVILVLDISC